MRFKALVVAVAAMLAQPAFAAGYGEFTGRWQNENRSTSDITRLRINAGPGGLSVRAWGQCHPVDCDWGVVNSVEYSYSPAANPVLSATEIIAIFNPGFAQKILILTDRPGDRLSYAIYTRYTDGSRRKPFVTRGTLRKRSGGWRGWDGFGDRDDAGRDGGYDRDGRDGGYDRDDSDGRDGGEGRDGALSFAEDCINFNWNQVEARFVSGEWKVTQGSMWMLSFGPRVVEAQRAAEIIRNYRFSQQCFLGRPNASMTYWKRGDSVPRSGMPGDDCVGNNPDTTQARRVGGQWKVVDGGHQMLAFGLREDEARRAEELIRHYRLNRQCFVGRPNASMTYWLSE
jgi:hypothetical protein